MNIKYVLHIFHHQSLISYLQESDRCGRNNQDSESIIFIYHNQYQLIENLDINSELNYDSFQYIDKFKFYQYINESVCRRRVINQYVDNLMFNECNNNYLKCDLCEHRFQELKRKKIDYHQLKNQEIIDLEELKQKIQEFQLICCHCLLNQQLDLMYNHQTNNCQLQNSEFNQNFAIFNKSIQSQLKFKTGFCCFQCLMPQNICRTQDKTVYDCSYQSSIPQILILLFMLN